MPIRGIISIAVLTLWLSGASMAQAAGARRYSLFPVDLKCLCVKTQNTAPPGMRVMEFGAGNKAVQVFLDKKTNHELFQASLAGWRDVLKPQYGVATVGDFNGDGVVDVSWYATVETNFVMYVFLSSPQGYRQIDVLKTFAQEWARQSGEKAPDLGDLAADYAIDQVAMERSAKGLALTGRISSTAVARSHIRPRILRVESRDFVIEPAKSPSEIPADKNSAR
ncbi:MAG: hypothetical protein ABSD20_03815 [Terriglobales bacterium]|jgi:hypothetical protein